MREVSQRLMNPDDVNAGMRWYTDPGHDLFVWVGPSGTVLRWQFGFGKGSAHEELLSWEQGRGIQHMRVDDGEHGAMGGLPGQKATPLMYYNGPWDPAQVARRLRDAGREVDPRLLHAVLAVLGEHR